MKRCGLIAYLTAEVISTTGTRMSMIAVPWFVLITTGSAALTGIVTFAEMLPYVLVQAFGGPLVDRVGVRTMAIVTDFIAAALVGLIPVLYFLDHLPFWALAVVVAVVGAVRGAGSTTYVLLPSVAGDAGTPIERATGLHDGMNRVATMVGVPLAGVLMAIWSAPTVLLLDAASFLIAGALLLLVPRSAQPEPTTRPDGTTSAARHYAEELRVGFSFLFRQPLLVAIALMVFVTNLLDQAYFAVLAPVWVRDELGSPLGLGLIGGVFGVGAVAGSALFAWAGPRLPRRPPFAWGFLVAGAPRFAVLALAVTLPPVLAVSLIAGLGVGAINPALSSTEYELVPRELQARVMGAENAIAWAGIPIGGLVGGFLVEGIGLTPTLLVCGGLYLLATLTPFVLPVWKKMDELAERGRAREAGGLAVSVDAPGAT